MPNPNSNSQDLSWLSDEELMQMAQDDQNASQDQWDGGSNPDDKGTGDKGQQWDGWNQDQDDDQGDDWDQGQQDQGDDDQDQWDQGKKTPSSIQKLLSQRRAANERADALEAENKQLNDRIAELEAKKDLTPEEQEALLDAKMDKKLNERDLKFEQRQQEREIKREFSDFMSNHPELSSHKADFEKAKQNHPNLSMDQIHLLWLQENNPEGISQMFSQKKQGYGVAWHGGVSGWANKSYESMSDAELESQIISSGLLGGDDL